MLASLVARPTKATAFSIGANVSMPLLLGITYKKSKALPNNSANCLIQPMTKIDHIGQKLKKEAEKIGLKPKDVAVLFGVKAPSVYDWYDHGRIHKKHYPVLIEKFGRPLSWWLDFPDHSHKVSEEIPEYRTATQRHTILNQLFDALPAKEQDDLIKSLEKKKQHYDAVVNELTERRKLG
jgi:hypothetical protein